MRATKWNVQKVSPAGFNPTTKRTQSEESARYLRGSNPEGFRSIQKGLVLNLLVTGDIARKDEGGRAV